MMNSEDVRAHTDALSGLKVLAEAGRLDEYVERFTQMAATWGGRWPHLNHWAGFTIHHVSEPQRQELRSRLAESVSRYWPDHPMPTDSIQWLILVYPLLLSGPKAPAVIETSLDKAAHQFECAYDPNARAAITFRLATDDDLPLEVVAALRRSLASGHDYLWADIKEYLATMSAFPLNPGEAWADAVRDHLDRSDAAWGDFLVHLGTASSAKPSARWLKRTRRFLTDLGEEQVHRCALEWLRLVGEPRTIPLDLHYDHQHDDQFDPHNTDYLRGLVWTVGLLPPNRDAIRVLDRLIVVSQRKIPGVGVRSQLTTNAAIHALSMIDDPAAVGQIARLAASVKSKPTLNALNKALDARAAALGISREEVEELSVPDYGLARVGGRTERLGEAECEITVEADGVKLLWRNASGKTVKSPPADVKRDHPETVKELKATVKDIAKMVSAQSERLDRQYLARRHWHFAAWRERYLDHPLVGTVARRLIWIVDGTAAVHFGGELRAVDGEPVKAADDAAVTLWHPIGRELTEVLAWRDLLEHHGIVQPFKQAHREVYLLTAAEENTRVYSNRFAAHILKQHQYNALAGARGWDNQLRLLVDDSFTPTSKQLPQWGLRAEFWVEGIGDDFNTDCTESGTFLRLASDQVRFYREDSPRNYAHAGGGGYAQLVRDPDDATEPLPLAEIPPLVLSEVLRDVDLFVGVSSVGNDPEWSDGGPEGRFQEYWHSYSFGDLGATALTRRELLQRLVPRLAIADRAEIDGKYLRVRGDIRTYKIHLGSGNILMEPDNEYLCIVPKQAGTAADGKVFLPFDGDRVLSLILSKALLLAKDTAITDGTITSQIRRR